MPGEGPTEGADGDVMAEAVRLAERVVDHQVRFLADEHLRAERLVRLAVATLAGKIAVIGLLFNAGHTVPSIAAVGLGLGVMAVCLGVVQLFRITAYAGRDTRINLGYDLGTLIDGLAGTMSTKTELELSIAIGTASAIQSNETVQERLVARRAVGASLLISGVFLHLVALAYIIRGSILA